MWNIIKQSLSSRVSWYEADLKEAIQKEWGKIIMTEIRKRIIEMPGRCKLL